MRNQDISADTNPCYRIATSETVVFFVLNRAGDISLELSHPGARVHVFAFYTGRGPERKSLSLKQGHLAPDTVSSATVKTALDDQASFAYDGTIRISKDAHRSDARQESRALLLSPGARAYARPALEILAHDVKCRHAATAGPPGEESLFFVTSRGISENAARKLLTQGFFQETLEQMEKLGVPEDELEKIRSQLFT